MIGWRRGSVLFIVCLGAVLGRFHVYWLGHRPPAVFAACTLLWLTVRFEIYNKKNLVSGKKRICIFSLCSFSTLVSEVGTEHRQIDVLVNRTSQDAEEAWQTLEQPTGRPEINSTTLSQARPLESQQPPADTEHSER